MPYEIYDDSSYFYKKKIFFSSDQQIFWFKNSSLYFWNFRLLLIYLGFHHAFQFTCLVACCGLVAHVSTFKVKPKHFDETCPIYLFMTENTNLILLWVLFYILKMTWWMMTHSAAGSFDISGNICIDLKFFN